MRWTILKEKQRGKEVFTIRRWVDGKNKRLDLKKYRSIRDNYEELEKLVKRLNAPIDLKEKVDFKHAFIDDALMAEYRTHLENTISGEGLVSTEISYIKYYFLYFFITKEGLINPADWVRLDSKYLSWIIADPKGPPHLGLKGIKAATTKRKVIGAANRFMLFLHKLRPDEIPKVEFTTIPKKKFKRIDADRRVAKETNDHVYIPKKDIDLILKDPPKNLAPFLHLLHKYGLRLAESLGVQVGTGDVMTTHFHLQRQLRKVGNYTAPKGGKPRKIPHWFCTAKEAARWVKEAQEHIVHPRTFSRRWEKYIKALNLDYTCHDMRHTWTTNAAHLPGIKPVQLKDAAGHESLATTVKYMHTMDGEAEVEVNADDDDEEA